MTLCARYLIRRDNVKDLYHTVNPIIRIKENELLSNETFHQLIEAESFEKIAEILRPTIYDKYLEQDFQFDFEKKLNQELFATYEEMIALVPEPEIVWIYTMRYTFHNLKVLTKAERMQENYDYLFMPDGFYSIEELKRAIQTGSSSRLPAEVLKSIREVNDYFKESTILQGIDVIYDRRFLKEQRRIGEKLGYQELLEEICHFIDLTNIITASRCLLQQRSQGFMSTVLSSAGSIPREAFLEFVNKPFEEFKTFLRWSDYGNLLAPALEADTIDFLKMDLIKDQHLSEFYERSQTTAFGPLPALTFMNQKDMEATNLRLIIVGKRSGFTKEQIRERMREVNEL
ncbi:V-type ATPase subunit [Enterococcus saccharolyticus]|nr:V-type ATPase subunit [Enterococcus saccharolyticus]